MRKFLFNFRLINAQISKFCARLMHKMGNFSRVRTVDERGKMNCNDCGWLSQSGLPRHCARGSAIVLENNQMLSCSAPSSLICGPLAWSVLYSYIYYHYTRSLPVHILGSVSSLFVRPDGGIVPDDEADDDIEE